MRTISKLESEVEHLKLEAEAINSDKLALESSQASGMTQVKRITHGADLLVFFYVRNCRGTENLWCLKTGGLLIQVTYSKTCTLGGGGGGGGLQRRSNTGGLKDRFNCTYGKKNYIKVAFMNRLSLMFTDHTSA